MLSTVLKALLFTHLVFTVGFTFMPILLETEAQKGQGLAKVTRWGSGRAWLEPQLAGPGVRALAHPPAASSGLHVESLPRTVRGVYLCTFCGFPEDLGASLSLFYLITPTPMPMGVWNQSPGSLPCQSAGTILGTLIGTAWNVAWQCQPLRELMSISTPTCWLSLIPH